MASSDRALSARVHRVGELDIGEVESFNRRQWRVQRAGWVVVLVVLAAASAGLLGRGPVAEASTADGPLRVDYLRIARHRAPSNLEIHLSSGTAEEGTVELWFDRRYFDGVVFQDIVPEPESTAVAADRVTFTFTVDGEAATTILVHLQHEDMGIERVGLGVVGGAGVTFRQFVLP